MNRRPYLILSGSIFGVVGALHFVRLATGTAVTIGGTAAPFWVSWIGGFAALGLAFWGWRLAVGRTR